MIRKIKNKYKMIPLLVLMSFFLPNVIAAQKITSPETFFGFKMGTDRKLANWDQMVKYFYHLEKESGRLKVKNMGPSTMGNPFMVLIISSSENIKNLKKYQAINYALSHPGSLKADQVEDLIKEGKVVICQSMGLHATEVGGPQMAPELIYDLLVRNDKDTR